MEIEEQNSGNRDVPYQCNFLILPRKERVEEPPVVSGLQSATDRFSSEMKVQKLIEMSWSILHTAVLKRRSGAMEKNPADGEKTLEFGSGLWVEMALKIKAKPVEEPIGGGGSCKDNV